MRILLLAFSLWLSGCAYTVRRDYNESGQLIGKTMHWRLIIQEEATLNVQGKYDLKFKSKPDPESVQAFREGIAAGKAMVK
jgi:hypothetical protein